MGQFHRKIDQPRKRLFETPYTTIEVTYKGSKLILPDDPRLERSLKKPRFYYSGNLPTAFVSRMSGRVSRCQRDVTIDTVGMDCIEVSTTTPNVSEIVQ